MNFADLVGCTTGEWPCKEQSSEVGGVSEDELEGLNAAVQDLNADIATEADKDRRNGGTKLSVFQTTRWAPFLVEWNVWYADHGTFLSRQFITPEFQDLKRRYEAMRQEWLNLGGATNAPSADTATQSQLFKNFPWTTLILIGAAGLGAYWLVGLGGIAALRSRT